MNLCKNELDKASKDSRIHKNQVKIRVLGKLESLPQDIAESAKTVMNKTEHYDKYSFNIALAYGGREELVQAIQKIADDVKKDKLEINDIKESVVSNYLYTKDLPDPDKIQTTYSSYLLGLCDLVGELRRTALDSIRAGKAKKADKYLTMMEDIYNVIIRFDYPAGLIPIKKKQDMVRGMIEKTRGELAVASCERRIEYRTDEFRGMLDKINGNRKGKQGKKKESKSDLDIDDIW